MKLLRVSLILALAATAAMADFSYKHETMIVGGSMAGPMKMAMKMSKTARDAMNGATYIKGNRMATRSGDVVTVYDLDGGTVTTIDNDKKQYSVLTFAEMQEYLQRMSEKLNSKKDESEVSYKVDIRDGSKAQDVYGYPAKLTVLAVLIEGSDKKGNSGAMEMLTDLWLSTSVSGSSEMTEFQKRLGEEIAGAGGMNLGMMGAMMKQKGFEQAMKEFQENAASMQGMPVLTVIRMAPAGNTGSLNADVGKLPEEKAASDDSSAAPSMGSVLRGMGGFGGFGRKKKNEEPAQQPQTSGGSGALMEMAIKNFDFSTAPVDDANLTVPQGYKQVESPMKKAFR